MHYRHHLTRVTFAHMDWVVGTVTARTRGIGPDWESLSKANRHPAMGNPGCGGLTLVLRPRTLTHIQEVATFVACEFQVW
jgi:hypothetical protein